ncbi:MAG: hypothetical protein FD180_4749 [Planctomycetota bacterium]|nr:MAG: hypothetical protein FD180_4749 [Planctomycetota bacterium]
MRALILFIALAAPATALTVDEVVQLAEAGVADDIIIEQMKADGSAFELSAREIVELQKKKVSPVVIRFMVAARGKQAPGRGSGKPAPLPAGEPVKSMEEEKDAVLTVRNVAKGIVSVLVYTREREIALVQGEIQSATVLFNGSHAEMKMPSGLYRVRWANEEAFRELAVAKNVTTEFEFRDDERFARGVRAVAIFDGKEEPDKHAAKVEPEPTKEDLIANPPTRVYTSPTNSNVRVIRDIQQVPTRLVIVPGNSSWSSTYDSCGSTYSYLSDHGYYSGGSCYRPTYYRSSYYRPTTYYHGGHSWHGSGHHYSRTADNVQYYLNWPFGHRHR